MRQSLAAMLVMSALATALGGCQTLEALNPFSTKPKPEPEVLAVRDWQKLQLENGIRITGEGIPGTSTASAGSIEQMTNFFEFTFWILPQRMFDYYLGKTPARYARMMESDTSADMRRTGILELVSRYEFARAEPYTRRYWQIAQGDRNSLVRAAAIRALNRSRNRAAITVYLAAMDDPSVMVRLEAAKALANVPEKKAIPVLLRHMTGEIDIRSEDGRMERQQEHRDVRLACADALRNFAERDVARALVDILRDRDFEVSWQARKSLVLMTGRDYRYNQARWRDYLATMQWPA